MWQIIDTHRLVIQCIALMTCAIVASPGYADQLVQQPDPELLERARQILKSNPLIDGHNDLPSVLLDRMRGDLDEAGLANVQPELPADIPRLQRGQVGAQFWAAHPRMDAERDHGAVRRGLRSIDVIRRMISRHPALELARTADDIERIFNHGKIAALIGMEGGEAIGGSLAVLRMLYHLGVRYLTLVHSQTTNWADAATDAPRHMGLSEFGEDVVREMNRLGMFVDLSHASVETAYDALRVSRAPVLFSHSNAREINAHPRNVPDDLLRRLAQNEGVIMVNFIPGYIAPTSHMWMENCGNSSDPQCVAAKTGIHSPEWKMRRDSIVERLHDQFNDNSVIAQRLTMWTNQNPWPRGSINDVADHIDHIRRVAGIDHIGIGADFYDAGGQSMVAGLGNVTKYVYLFAELLRRGYSESDVIKIAGGNLLRAMRRIEQISDKMRAEQDPLLAEMHVWSK